MNKFGFLAVLTRFLSEVTLFWKPNFKKAERSKTPHWVPLSYVMLVIFVKKIAAKLRYVSDMSDIPCANLALKSLLVYAHDLIIQLEVNKKYIKKYVNNRTKIVFANEP